MHPQHHEFSKPLAERLLPAESDNGSEDFVDLGAQLVSKGTSRGCILPTPFVTRIPFCCECNDVSLLSLSQSRLQLGLSTLGLSKAVPGLDVGMSLNSGVDIVPVYADEPIPFEIIGNAAVIEMQLLKHSADAKQKATRSSWKALLPSDLMNAGQMSQRVDLLRHSTLSPHPVVGAAIASSRVYDDVRYLCDMGFDYVCLMSEVVYGFGVDERLQILPLDNIVDDGLRALHDSGRADFSLMVCGAFRSAEQILQCLSAGVRAVGIDSYLMSHRPMTQNRAPEGFGAFLVDYAGPQENNATWIERAFGGLTSQLTDSISFAGYSSLAELLRSNGK